MKIIRIHQLLTASLLATVGATLAIAEEITLNPKVLGSVKMVGVGGGGLRTIETGCRLGGRVVGSKTMWSKPYHTTYKSVLEFDLNDLPQGAKIDSATLQLTRNTARPSSWVTAWGFVGDGKLTTADWFGNVLEGATSKLNEACSIPVTKFVQDLALASKQYAGFSLSGTTFSLGDPFGFDSLSTDPKSSPSLIIKYTIVK